jgi:hypothetical protein
VRLVLQFFDYVYYRAYNRARGKDSSPSSYGAVFVAMLQSLTLLAAVIYPCVIIAPVIDKWGKVTVGVLALTLYLSNLYRYSSVHRYEELSLRWESDSPADRRRGTRRIVYCVIAVLVILILESILDRKLRGV